MSRGKKSKGSNKGSSAPTPDIAPAGGKDGKPKTYHGYYGVDGTDEPRPPTPITTKAWVWIGKEVHPVVFRNLRL